MLERVILNNFKSFKEETIIDFYRTNYSILPQNVSEDGVLKGAIFVGANASGKSNIILGIKLLLDLMFLDYEANSPRFLCFTSGKPTYSVDYYFRIMGCQVRYYFEVNTRKDVVTEKLYLDDALMMERLGVSAKSYIADPSGVVYDEADVDKNTLFLRTLFFNTKFSSNEVLKTWMQFLMNSIYVNFFMKTIVSYGRKDDIKLTRYLQASGENTINDFFKKYNFEQSIEYSHRSEGNGVVFFAGEDEDEKGIFFKRKGIEVPIPFPEESLGNQNLLRILPAYFSVITEGGMLLVDEFSSGFHNNLEAFLVKHFMEKSKNSQMIFVSHSTNLLSNSLLRPDQEYVVEFADERGSMVKRFSTEQPRAAQNVEKMYVSGVFGGLPDYKGGENEA